MNRKCPKGLDLTVMKIFIATFVIIDIAMALGVILSNKRIRGSCGGLVSLGIDKACDCDKPCARRRRLDAPDRFEIDVGR